MYSPAFKIDVLFLYARPKSDVFSHSHVLEKCEALKHEAHPTLLYRELDHVLFCRPESIMVLACFLTLNTVQSSRQQLSK